MKTLFLTGQEIRELGFPQGKVIGTIIRVVSENYTLEQKEYVLNFLRGIIKRPERFQENKIFGEVVSLMITNTAEVEIRKKGKRAPLIVEQNEVGRPSLAA